MKKINLLILTFCLLSSGFMTLNYYYINSDKLYKLKFKSFWLQKTFFEPGKEMLIIGDSRVYRGINPDQDPKKRNIMNLGYSSAGISSELINTVIEYNDNPKVTLVLGITPLAFTDPSFSNHVWKRYLQTSRLDRLIDENYFFNQLFSPFSLDQLKKSHPHPFKQTFFYKTGFVGTDHENYDTSIAVNSYTKTFSEYKFNPKLFLSTANTLKGLIKNGIKVYAFLMPVHRDLKFVEDNQSGFRLPFAKKTLTEIGVKWIDLNFTNSVQSYDGSHMNFETANKFSRIIFSQIN